MATKNLDNIRRKEYKYYVSFYFYNKSKAGVRYIVLDVNKKINTIKNLNEIKEKIFAEAIEMIANGVYDITILGIIPLER